MPPITVTPTQVELVEAGPDDALGDRSQRVRIYLETRRTELPQWQHWVRNGELERLLVVAQAMRHHATTLELPGLEPLGNDLYIAAKSGNVREVALQLSILENYFNRSGRLATARRIAGRV